jgi:drug/metabolite transporter (DMT)-like permease
MSMTAFGVLRLWTGLPFILLYAWATGGFVFGSTSMVLVGLAGGIVNAFIGTGLFYYALHHGSMHESNILANTSPFWGVVSAIVVLGEPASAVTFGAGALVIVGTYFLVRGRSSDGTRHSLRALTAAVAAGILWGFTTAVPTKYCMGHGMSPIAYQVLFAGGAGACWTVAAVPGFVRRRLTVTRRGVWIAFLSSFFGLFVGWVMWLMALQRVEASVLSPLGGLTLLFAAVLGAVLLRQRLTPKMAVGGALVLAGVTFVSVFAG